MTDWRSLRGSNFLSPEDLESGPALCTIVAVHGEEMIDDNEKVKKEIAVTIKGRHRNPQTGQGEDLVKTEWVANVVNCTLLEALFGTPHYEKWINRQDRRIVLQSEPCEVPGKYFGQPSVRVGGSPDIEADIRVDVVLKMKGGKKRKPIPKVLRSTKNGGPPVNATTGEVLAPPVPPPAVAASVPPNEPEPPQSPVSDDQAGGPDDAAIPFGDAVEAPPAEPLSTNADRTALSYAVRDSDWGAAYLATHITLTYDGADGPQALTRSQIAECTAYVKANPKGAS